MFFCSVVLQFLLYGVECSIGIAIWFAAIMNMRQVVVPRDSVETITLKFYGNIGSRLYVPCLNTIIVLVF